MHQQAIPLSLLLYLNQKREESLLSSSRLSPSSKRVPSSHSSSSTFSNSSCTRQTTLQLAQSQSQFHWHLQKSRVWTVSAGKYSVAIHQVKGVADEINVIKCTRVRAAVFLAKELVFLAKELVLARKFSRLCYLFRIKLAYSKTYTDNKNSWTHMISF